MAMTRTFLSVAWVFTAAAINAQWCVPTTAIPYAASMPGITHFACNTIDRTSTDIENYPNNSYVSTGLTTELEKGATYAVTIGFTIDNIISPHMNLRIWIDMNHDGQLDDVGETLLSVDHLAGPVYTGQITIPNTAMTGPTRMRVTAKMCSHGGHTLPSPCDLPADPFGYHGELEDYTADIVDAVGIPEIDVVTGLSASATELNTTFHFSLLEAGDVRLEVLDARGRLLLSNTAMGNTQGEQVIVMPALAEQGVYIGRLWLNGRPHAVRFFR